MGGYSDIFAMASPGFYKAVLEYSTFNKTLATADVIFQVL